MRIYIGLFYVIIMVMCTPKNNKIYIDDVRQYKGTPVWDLAMAIKEKDVEKVEKICKKEPTIIDNQNSRFGQTVLHWAVMMEYLEPTKILLKYGANPNLQRNDGVSAFIESCRKYRTAEYAKLLLKYGGDPNAIAHPEKEEGFTQLKTPLIVASKSNTKIALILVKAGANIDYIDEQRQFALKAALLFDNIELARYYLIEKGAKYKQVFQVTHNGDSLFINHYLRNLLFPLGSKEYKIKMEVVDFLEERGIDYWKTEIPKHYYNNYSKEYLEKY